MKVINSTVENGSLYAELLIDRNDIEQFSSEQRAVEYFIMAHAKENNASSLLLTRVTEMNEHEDGSLSFRFEAAVAPAVVLGQYKGVPVDVGHCEDFSEAAVTAAARNIQVEIPKLLIDRKLETLMLEKQTELLQSVSLNVLADTYEILKALDGEQDEDSRRADAMEIAETYLNMGVQDMDYFAECISDVFFEAENGEISAAVAKRAEERSTLPPETVALQVFEAYLHTQEMSLDEWREANLSEADRQCRVDFLLGAVADAENLTASDTELDKAAYDLAVQYQMSDKDVLAIVGEEALRHQIRMAKARELITENANNL